jgi:hypothetical protein
MALLTQENILREYIRAASLGLPDARTGGGYGSTKPGSGVGSTYQKQSSYPYRDPDILDDDEEANCEEDEWSCIDVDDQPEDVDLKIHNKVRMTHASPDPHSRRDMGSFSGHSVRFDLHQSVDPREDTLLEKGMGISGNSISPIPNLYKGRQAAGATGGVSPSGTTTGPASKGGVTSIRGFASSQKLPKDEKKPRKFRLVDILFGEEEDEDEILLMLDEEV